MNSRFLIIINNIILTSSNSIILTSSNSVSLTINSINSSILIAAGNDHQDHKRRVFILSGAAGSEQPHHEQQHQNSNQQQQPNQDQLQQDSDQYDSDQHDSYHRRFRLSASFEAAGTAVLLSAARLKVLLLLLFKFL